MKSAYYPLFLLSAIATANPLDRRGTSGTSQSLAPLLKNANPIPDDYIIAFKDGHSMWAHETFIGRNLSDNIHIRWEGEDLSTPYGYAARLDDDTLALVRSDPMIKFVEQDFIFDLEPHIPHVENATASMLHDERSIQRRSPTYQKNAEWNLVVVSAQSKVRGNAKGTFYYDTNAAGQGVDIYICDSGINIKHVDFGGRAKNLYDATETTFADESNIGGTLGHGTQVADVAAGKTYGVAKKANLWSVKIAQGPNNTGFGRDAVNGIIFIVGKHKKRKAQTGFRGSIINFSVKIEPPSDKGSLGDALDMADSAGIVLVAAAGNSNDEAINRLPAAYSPPVITVASMTDQWALSASASYGSKVAIIAPGAGIKAASADSSNNKYTRTSGSSMACPLVTGVIAQWMSWANGPTTPSAVRTMLNSFALKNLVDIDSAKSDTPNYLINSGAETKGWPGHGETR